MKSIKNTPSLQSIYNSSNEDERLAISFLLAQDMPASLIIKNYKKVKVHETPNKRKTFDFWNNYYFDMNTFDQLI